MIELIIDSGKELRYRNVSVGEVAWAAYKVCGVGCYDS